MSRPPPGILLAQLGTPDAPTAPALRRFLREFLSDPRVVDLNRALWWLILNGIILRVRPAKSAALYRRVWTERGSPLLLTTLDQAAGLSTALGDGARVEVGMRYGNPSIASGLDRLQETGVDRILVFPLFPQYSAATTASIVDAVGAHFARRRVVPALRWVPPYYEHPAYVGALAAVAREEIAKLPWTPEKLIISFHGVPKRYVDLGDPYRSHSEATARALVAALGLSPGEHELTFQSRFGREEWLQPYTDRRLEELGRSGIRRVAAICPGFVADCLETIDEIGREGRRQFREAGGEDLALIPCLNSHPAWIRGLEAIAREELAGWL